MPPEPFVTEKSVRGEYLRKPEEDDEAIQYFNLILPRLKAAESAKKEDERMTFIEFIQEPGDTVFVPSNWWHGVLKLDDTVAVT